MFACVFIHKYSATLHTDINVIHIFVLFYRLYIRQLYVCVCVCNTHIYCLAYTLTVYVHVVVQEFVCPWINGKNNLFSCVLFYVYIYCCCCFKCVIRYTALSLYLSLFIFSVVLEVNEVLFSFLLWARVHCVKKKK